jgi:hypothetical protein
VLALSAGTDPCSAPRRWLPISQEHRASRTAGQQPWQEECGPRLPEHPLGRSAFAPDACALIGQVEILERRSRSSMLSARISLARAADSYI